VRYETVTCFESPATLFALLEGAEAGVLRGWRVSSTFQLQRKNSPRVEL
jgi:hypothetical protein